MKNKFRLESNFKPSGEQPMAIDKLYKNLTSGKNSQVLLGVTGSGKTFVMANLIEKLQRPALIISPNKILAAQLKMDEWRVHVGIGLVRKQMGLERWNSEREDCPEEFKVKKTEE